MKNIVVILSALMTTTLIAGCQSKKNIVTINKMQTPKKEFGDTPRPIIIDNAGDIDFKVTRNDANKSWIARHIYTEPQYRGNIGVEPINSRLHRDPQMELEKETNTKNTP